MLAKNLVGHLLRGRIDQPCGSSDRNRSTNVQVRLLRPQFSCANSRTRNPRSSSKNLRLMSTSMSIGYPNVMS